MTPLEMLNVVTMPICENSGSERNPHVASIGEITPVPQHGTARQRNDHRLITDSLLDKRKRSEEARPRSW